MNGQGSAAEAVRAPDDRSFPSPRLWQRPRCGCSITRPSSSFAPPKPPRPSAPTAPIGSIFGAGASSTPYAPLPASPETVALYLTALAATHRPATMTRRLTAITKAHQIAGEPSPATMQQPAVSETLKGIRRTLGTAQTTKAALAHRRHSPHARRSAGYTRRLPRSRAPAARLCRRLPPLRTRRPRCRGCSGYRRRPGRQTPAFQNGSGRAGKRRRHPLWFDSFDLPGSSTHGVEDGRRHRRRAVIPRCRSPWPPRSDPPAQGFRGTDRKARRRSRRPRSRKVRRPFLARRSRDAELLEWRRRTRHHAPNRTPLARHGPPLHPRRLALPRKPGVGCDSRDVLFTLLTRPISCSTAGSRTAQSFDLLERFSVASSLSGRVFIRRSGHDA